EKPTRYLICIPYVGWLDHTFVFPDSVIPPDADVVYQSGAPGEHYYRTSGTLEEWREKLSRKAIGNSRLVVAESTAFAGCLLRPLRVQSGGIHFHSFSSMGKSTTQVMAGSVCGGGGELGFGRSWRSTGNALELTAELHNDCTLVLDEISQIDVRELDHTIYMLANGTGKGRGTRTMTARRTAHWRVMLLSSGELTIEEYLATIDRKMKAGIEVRLLSIPADAGAGMGLFENLHGAASPQAFAGELGENAKQFFGTALREFIARFIANAEGYIENGSRFIDQFVAAQTPKGAAPE